MRVVWVRMALIRVVWGQISDEWIQVRVTRQGQAALHTVLHSGQDGPSKCIWIFLID